MRLLSALTLLGVLCLQIGAEPVSAAKQCRTQKECQQAHRVFFDAKKTIKLNITGGSVIVEPDGRKFTVTKDSKFTFVGFLKLTVRGSGTIEKSFPNGEEGGKVSFFGIGTIQYNDSGEVVFEGSKERKLEATANDVTKVVLLDDTIAVVEKCRFVYAYRNSKVYATDCDDVAAYTEAQAIVERCKKAAAHDNAKLTDVTIEAQ